MDEQRSGTVLERPIHFIVVLWGKRFSDYFVDFCLPSLMAPGNLPALSTQRPSKLLIATRPEDWDAISRTPIFQAAQRYIRPVFIEIPPCPVGRSPVTHMGEGHRLALALCYDEAAYGIVLTPDCMLSDGTVTGMQAHAAAGKTVVLAAALRFSEEGFLGLLRQDGLIPASGTARNGTPIAITGAGMVSAACRSLHPETLRFEWDNPTFPPFFLEVPSAAFWRVPKDGGIVLPPLLVDFSAMRRHDVSTLDEWTLDGNYIFANFGEDPAVHVVTDSDEMFIASWGPNEDGRRYAKTEPLFGQWGKGALFRAVFYGPMFNPLKRRIFASPVRWHAAPIDEAWIKIENRAQRILDRFLWPSPQRRGTRAFVFLLALVVRIEVARRLAQRLLVHARRVVRACSGDREARRWCVWALRRLYAEISGRMFHEPAPEVRD
jgi:hypothetical protein